MLNIYPDFYDSFRCLAAACPDSCCAAWAVVVDEAAAERYARVTGPLGDKLRQVMETDEDGDLIFRLELSRCPFWDTDGLCRIQRELGEGGLCETCYKFPRLTHDYGSFIEHGLTIACPEAARLILTHEGPRKLLRRWDGRSEEETDLKDDWLLVLQEARQSLLEELWAGECREEEALAVCLLHARWFQDGFDGFEPDPWDRESALAEAKTQRGDGCGINALLRLHRGLEVLTPEWGELLREAEQWKDPLPPLPQTGMARPLAEEYLYRYWLQAVNDGDCLSRMVLLAMNHLVVRHLARIRLAQTGKLTTDDLLRLFQLYAKEVEHDECNREALLEALAEENAPGVDSLVATLLHP